MQTTPNSMRRQEVPSHPLLCKWCCGVQLPRLSTMNTLELTEDRFCTTENRLNNMFLNIISVEIAQSLDLCRPLMQIKLASSHLLRFFPFLARTSVPGTTGHEFAKLVIGWDQCSAPFDTGMLGLQHLMYMLKIYTSYTGLTWSQIFATIVVANISSLSSRGSSLPLWSVFSVGVNTAGTGKGCWCYSAEPYVNEAILWLLEIHHKMVD